MKRRREADSSTLLPARSTSRTTFDVLGMVPLHFSCVRLLQGFLEPVVRGGGWSQCVTQDTAFPRNNWAAAWDSSQILFVLF